MSDLLAHIDWPAFVAGFLAYWIVYAILRRIK